MPYRFSETAGAQGPEPDIGAGPICRKLGKTPAPATRWRAALHFPWRGMHIA